MALIYCSACGKQISAAAPSCPQCGHPSAAAPKKVGGEVFRGVITGLAVLAVLLVIAGIVLVATKPSEAKLRAAAEAKLDHYYKTEYKPDGTKVRVLVNQRGHELPWALFWKWEYRDHFFASELVLRMPDGKDVTVARGLLGQVRLFED